MSNRLFGIFLIFVASSHAGVLDNWATNTLPISNVTAAAYGNGVLVATATPGPGTGWLGVSLDGVHWNTAQCGAVDCTPPPLYTVSFLNNRFIAAGFDGSTYVSTNGLDWRFNFVEPGGASLRSICYGNGSFVVGGEMESCPCGFIAASSDGVSWSPLQVDGLPFVQGIAYGNGRFVSVALSEYGSAYYRLNILTATNPLVPWTPTGVATTNDLFSITFGNGRFVAVGQEHHSRTASILWSTNGVAWENSDSPVSSPLGSVSFEAGLFLASSDSGAILSSSNGIVWSTHPVGSMPQGPAFLVRDSVWFPSSSGFLHSDPLVRVNIARSPQPELILSGLEDRLYRIEDSSALSPGAWSPVQSVYLFGSPTLWRDTRPLSGRARFYRAVLLDP